MSHHEVGPVCPSCEEKLEQAHPRLAEWFRTKIKPTWADAHIAWSYRDQANQDEAYAEGKSKLQYPHSPHNATEGEKPCARALDLFQMPKAGSALFPVGWYKDIALNCQAWGEPIVWGGMFTHLGDFDHFQLSKSVE